MANSFHEEVSVQSIDSVYPIRDWDKCKQRKLTVNSTMSILSIDTIFSSSASCVH